MDSNNETPLGFWGSESEAVIARLYPIHKACRDGDLATLSRAVAVATPDQLVSEDQFYGWTPIHWAAYFGKTECLNGLLMTGVNVNVRTSRFQQTPAHISAFGGHPNCLCELLKSGADFHARDYLGEIPLHKAARVGNVECIRTLVGNGTHANICNNNGHTAGDLSRMQNFKECAHLLDIACSQLNAQQLPMNGCNGHHIENGTSGSQVSNGNGHSNGWGHTNGVNGTTNGVLSRKRSYDDASIPTMKRPRITDDLRRYDMEISRKNCDETKTIIKGVHRVIGFHCDATYDDVMDCHGNDDVILTTSPEIVNCAEDVNYIRAPSPGMDMKLYMSDDDLQLWGHLHGYGDTAESIPDDDSVKLQDHDRRDSSFCQSLRGIQSRGWY